MRPHSLPLAPALLLLVSACGATPQTPESKFEEQMRAFHQHMRWGRYNEASSFVATGDREEFLGEYEELGDDYQVTEYEIEGVSYDSEEQTAVVTVWVQSIRLPSTRVVETDYTETWTWDPALKTWQITERTEEAAN